MEELLTEQMSTIGRALTYMSDQDIMELLYSEFVANAIKAADMVWLERYDEYDMIRNGIDEKYLRGDEAQLLQECRELLDKHLEVSDRDIDNRWDGRYKITPAPIRCRGVLLFAFCQGNDDVNTFLNT